MGMQLPISQPKLPKRIILVRHGESKGNHDTSAYTTTPDHRMPLTSLGIQQSRAAGQQVKEVISECECNWKVYFIVSPYKRTRETLKEMGRSFPRGRMLGVHEECRIREQDFGNFQVEDRMRILKHTRQRFGRFFFRFQDGESAADVFNRVTSFKESMWRDIDMNIYIRRLNQDDSSDTNLVIVSHGLTLRVFLMKWFKWSVDQFEKLSNLDNGEFRVMELGPGGDYSLAIHHTVEELQDWGLSPEMIADQQLRATGGQDFTWNLDIFFDDCSHNDEDDDNEDHTALNIESY